MTKRGSLRDAAIVAGVEAGLTYVWLARKYGVSKQRIEQIVRKAGLKIAPNRALLLERAEEKREQKDYNRRRKVRERREKRQQLEHLVNEKGLSIMEACRRAAVPHKTCQEWMKRGKICLITRHGRWRDLSERNAEWKHRYHVLGHTAGQIAIDNEVQISTVKKIVGRRSK